MKSIGAILEFVFLFTCFSFSFGEDNNEYIPTCEELDFGSVCYQDNYWYEFHCHFPCDLAYENGYPCHCCWNNNYWDYEDYNPFYPTLVCYEDCFKRSHICGPRK
ncbi:UNVERIFIED_CONTAM: hypothetical protein RMT77_019017 [Armadillidium vulgare]